MVYPNQTTASTKCQTACILVTVSSLQNAFALTLFDEPRVLSFRAESKKLDLSYPLPHLLPVQYLAPILVGMPFHAAIGPGDVAATEVGVDRIVEQHQFFRIL